MSKRILFEGTEQQIENLKNLLSYGDNDLPKEVTDKFLGNLWSNEDVQQNYKCDDDDAQEILDFALTNEGTMTQIWEAIDMGAEEVLGSMVDFYEYNMKNRSLAEAVGVASTIDWTKISTKKRPESTMYNMERVAAVERSDLFYEGVKIGIYYQMNKDKFRFALLVD